MNFNNHSSSSWYDNNLKEFLQSPRMLPISDKLSFSISFPTY